MVRLVACIFLASLLFQPTPSARGQGAPAPAAAPPPPPDPANGLKPCSTETVNGNCYINVDRRYPITLPTIQMRKGTHIVVKVYYPYAFETLTLDAGTAQAFEGTDQGAGLLTALLPQLKSATWSQAQSFTEASSVAPLSALAAARLPVIDCGVHQPDPTNQVVCDVKNLNTLLTQTMKPAMDYFRDANEVYAVAREILAAAPQPRDATATALNRGPGVPSAIPNPWENYADWRTEMLRRLHALGIATSDLLGELPGTCQKPTDPVPQGPWVAPPRLCFHAGDTTAPPPVLFGLPPNAAPLFAQLLADYATFNASNPDEQTRNDVAGQMENIEARYHRVQDEIGVYAFILPTAIGKITTDMQTLEGNIIVVPPPSAPPPSVPPTFVGDIPDPVSTDPADAGFHLIPSRMLGRQTVYTLNAQNRILNSLLQLPAATQKQAVVTITALYADPRFEVSTGAFFSWMPNRTFANFTTVSIVGGTTPTQGEIIINETTSSPPEIIPFAAANYRLGHDFRSFAGRRGAVYGTLAVGLNPYNTTVEYAAGFSFSWRFLMFSPLFHIGENTHLTQGEMPNQVWCGYGSAYSATTTPPLCAGSPPAPSTTTFWRGAAAFGIGIRIPTTFAATNH
ncbi:MAG TPA: hypothetical protein VHX60_04805 [Acidobacteriaceae bacterium]|nr:hypothetical protein [Acidobacteriaceae bacterium]